MKKILVFVFLLNGVLSDILCQISIKTVAEASNFESTSKYNDVLNFIEILDRSSKFIRTETMAVSEEGRDIPLMIIADPMPEKPEDLKNDPRIVVYLQGNIHAGEVEGKEALMMFARDIKKNEQILKNIVLLICPIFNADGNEKISVKNRTNQNGPKNGVGVRYNGSFLDLNRDAVKMESPEMTGLITNVLNRWDPYVMMDYHTTNGVFRQEPTTFSWMLNPNGNQGLIHYMRDKMMPEINKNLLNKYKIENCFYGEFEDLGKMDEGYVSYAHEPRYIVNYAGLRNRLAILNENYVHADFRSRVEGCYYLSFALMDYIIENKNEIKKLVKAADDKNLSRWTDSAVIDSFSFDYKVVPVPYPVTIKVFEVEKDANTQNYLGYKPTDVKKTITIPYLADYVATTNIAYPYAYMLTVPDKSILNKLTSHGIIVEKLIVDQTFEVERFDIKSLKGSRRLNQGHYTNTAEGTFIPEKKTFEKGTYVVRTSQPLAALAVYLLEPQSGDGLLYWNFFDRYLVPQWGDGYYPYPVYRLNYKVDFASEKVN
ncbi:MAG: M14 family metallopeptidase [Saprospiraceae bacterium]|nr:M14 family metallopeptidase [Saprospiraceae bacterium]